MKKLRFFQLIIILILLFLFFFCLKSASIEGYLQSRYDFLESMPLPFANYAFCFTALILAMIFNVYNYIRKKVMCKTNLIVFLLAVSFVSLTTVKNYIYYSQEIKLLEQNYIERTFLDNIETILDSGTTATIYVGRADCDYCQEVDPLIRRYAYYGQHKMYYYDTFADREYNTEYMKLVLERLGVDSVPSIISIENGMVTQVMEYDEILKWLGIT